MPTCVALGCSNKSPIKGVTFHKIPKEETIQKLWIDAIRRDKWFPSKWSRICSDHFRPEDFDRTSPSSTRIRQDAVPSIFPELPPDLPNTAQKRRGRPRLDVQASQKTVKKRRVLHRCDVQALAESEKENSKTKIETPPGNTSHASLPDVTDSPGKTIDQLKRRIAELEKEKSIDQLLSKIAESEKEKTIDQLQRSNFELKKENIIYKKKVKVLQQSRQRLNKRNSKLSSVISELKQKKLANDDGLSNILKKIPGINEELLSRQLSKCSGAPLLRVYSPQLRAFAMTLHYYSPKAYNYVRKVFNTCLPHPKTLTKMISVH